MRRQQAGSGTPAENPMSESTPPLSPPNSPELLPPEPAPDVVLVSPRKPRYWLHGVLFLLTVFTTLVVGAQMENTFQNQLLPYSTDDAAFLAYFPLEWALRHPSRLLLGIPFSFSLLLILFCHEMGHYLYCVRYRIDATLPYFLPFPTMFGTLGAFIRIRSPIRTRSQLFDVGIAGPIAGFAVAIIVLFAGLAKAKPGAPPWFVTGIAFNYPPIFHIAHRILALFGGRPEPLEALYLPPIAMAAWVGMFATALNLLPGGQLDGGHILYSIFPRAHKLITVFTVGVLLPLGRLFQGWWIFAAFLVISGWQHPPVPEEPQLPWNRRLLGLVALAIFLLTVTPWPVRIAN